MSKLFNCTILLALAALIAACSSPTPTPTATPVPPAPTATPTPAPTPTAAPALLATPPASGSGALAPIGTNDPQAFMSELSDAEQFCLAGTSTLSRSWRCWEASPASSRPRRPRRWSMPGRRDVAETVPDRTDRPDRAAERGVVRVRSQWICELRRSLRDARHTCGVRCGGGHGGQHGGLPCDAFCLNDEEWQAVGPSLGMAPDDRDGLQCVLVELGGPEGLTAALQPGAGPPTAFFGAAAACNLQMAQGESGTIAPTPAPSAILLSIVVAPVPGAIPEYDRDEWRHWTDEDGDCQDVARRCWSQSP